MGCDAWKSHVSIIHMTTAELPLIPNPDTLWGVDAVAKYLSASKSWVYKAAERGELPCIRIGAMLRFAPNSVRAWLKRRAGGAT